VRWPQRGVLARCRIDLSLKKKGYSHREKGLFAEEYLFKCENAKGRVKRAKKLIGMDLKAADAFDECVLRRGSN
jgi:hypothetical protein